MKKFIKIVLYICGLCLIIGLGFLAEVGTGGVSLLQKEKAQLQPRK